MLWRGKIEKKKKKVVTWHNRKKKKHQTLTRQRRTELSREALFVLLRGHGQVRSLRWSREAPEVCQGVQQNHRQPQSALPHRLQTIRSTPSLFHLLEL
jgi:hypothetical protein